MNQSKQQRLIADIKQALENQTLDSDTRLALQKARARALQKSSAPWRTLPWFKFAMTASLFAVLAINLPNKKSVPTLVTKPETVAANTAPSKSLVKPIITPVKKPVEVKAVSTEPSADADLLENMELYEDAEFYQWLSEQDTQGVTDA